MHDERAHPTSPAATLVADDAANRDAERTTWLVFALGATEYAVDVASVQQIIGLQPITRVPRMPDAVRGVINLRGRVVPIVDLRIRFNLEAVDHGQRTCIIVVRTAGADVGIVVDRVLEVARVAVDTIEDAPQFGGSDTVYLRGVAKHDGRVLLLLDTGRALSGEQLDALDAAAVAGQPPA